MDEDDVVRLAPVATKSTIVMPPSPTSQGGDEVKPTSVAAIPTIMVFPKPVAPIETDLAPRGSL